MGESHATSRSSRARAARCVRWSRPCSCSQAQSGRFGSKAPLWRLQPLVHSFSLTPVFSGLPWEKSRSTVSKDAISAILASHHSQLQGPARVRTGQARPPDDHFAPADVCGGRPAGDGGRHEVDIPREIGRVGGLVLLLPLVLSGNLPSRHLGFLKHPLEIAPRTPPHRKMLYQVRKIACHGPGAPPLAEKAPPWPSTVCVGATRAHRFRFRGASETCVALSTAGLCRGLAHCRA